AEDDRGRWLRRVAVDLVPGRMVGVRDAKVLEHRIGLRVFLGKRIRANPMVFKKLLDLHASPKRKRAVPAGRLAAERYLRSSPSIMLKNGFSFSVTVRWGP